MEGMCSFFISVQIASQQPPSVPISNVNRARFCENTKRATPYGDIYNTVEIDKQNAQQHRPEFPTFPILPI